jgi:Icc-related predicted phosphoesterase
MAGPVVRVAALADLHCTKTSQGAFQTLFARVSESADIVVIAGDLTDNGLPEEAAVLARELSALRIPAAAVLGNHDLESGNAAEITAILTDAGVRVLDGDGVEIQGVGFAGVKGFAGGFGARALQSWGEDVMKRFVREAVDEALKLEAALARLTTEQRETYSKIATIARCFGRGGVTKKMGASLVDAGLAIVNGNSISALIGYP